jgi:ribosomal protein L11 methyltransferase
MSFGTGHHDTTYLLCKTMLEMDWAGKKVLDVGTGTGVLAILAQFLGASTIVGTEIDPGSFDNALENVEKNHVTSIELLALDIDAVTFDGFDVILANINKNVLKRHLPFYKEKLKKNGILMMSGFFASDIEELKEHAAQHGFEILNKYVQNEWAVVKYKKI